MVILVMCFALFLAWMVIGLELASDERALTTLGFRECDLVKACFDLLEMILARLLVSSGLIT